MKIKDICPVPPGIMGIVNVTPDSFSDGGKYLNFKKAVERGEEIVKEGGDIIDVGGESTRPGADEVSEETEIQRVVPVIRELALKQKLKVSCDTSKPGVAARALEAGAVMINDVCGAGCSAMREEVKNSGAALCIMHMKGNPRTMQKNPGYDDVVTEVRDFLIKRAQTCVNEGIAAENIILDPGIGFGKTAEHNLKIIARVKEFSFSYPLLVGVSRKSFIGAVLNRPVNERLAGSLAAACFLFLNGVYMLRVHNVKETFEAAKLLQEIKGIGNE